MPRRRAAELAPPPLRSSVRRRTPEAYMEKVALLCLLIALISVLADLSPAPQPRRQ